MSDQWERQQFGNMGVADAGSDSDGDGASDADEYRALTNPQNAADYCGLRRWPGRMTTGRILTFSN